MYKEDLALTRLRQEEVVVLVTQIYVLLRYRQQTLQHYIYE